MSDKDDIFDMEFGEETVASPPPYQRHQRGRSQSLSVTLHQSKSLQQTKEKQAQEYQRELELKRGKLKDEREQDDGFESDDSDKADEESEPKQEQQTPTTAGVTTKNYNAVKMKYFQALNISKTSAPIAAPPRPDPNAIFNQPIQSAPTSAPIPIAADHRFFYEITGQTLDTFIPPHEMGRGKNTVAVLDRPRKKTFHAI